MGYWNASSHVWKVRGSGVSVAIGVGYWKSRVGVAMLHLEVRGDATSPHHSRA